MTWVLLGAVVVLGVGLLAMVRTSRRLNRRVGDLEQQMVSPAVPSTSAHDVAEVAADLPHPKLDVPAAEFVITGLGTSAAEEAAPTVEARLFTDIVLRETVVHAASFVHGVRRALAPESRNRIRFEMRREVKRSRKQRRADVREARREWEARQRAGIRLADDPAEDSAA